MRLLFTQYGLFGKSIGIVKTAPVAVVAAPVVLEKSIAANKIYIKPMLSSLEGIGSFFSVCTVVRDVI